MMSNCWKQLTLPGLGFLTGFLLTFLLELFIRTQAHPFIFVFNGYHIHHSTLGLLLILSGLVLKLKNLSDKLAVFILTAGIGIIIMHTLSDGRLIFFERIY